MARFINQDDMLRMAADYDRVVAERDAALQALRECVVAIAHRDAAYAPTTNSEWNRLLTIGRALVGDTAVPRERTHTIEDFIEYGTTKPVSTTEGTNDG